MSTVVGAMRSLFLDYQLDFATTKDQEVSEDILLRILGVQAMLNLYELRKNPRLPKLYSREAGVRYCPPDQMEGCWIDKSKIPAFVKYLKGVGAKDDKIAIMLRLIAGTEIFQDTATLYHSKKGDCDRLIGARLAELWLAGLSASPYLIPYDNGTGGTTYHAVVLHRDGSSEDPSLILGMPGPPGAREEEIRKNFERHDNLLQAASDLMLVDGASPELLGAIIDQAAFAPRGGYRH